MMKWLLKEYMTRKHIASFRELAKLTGIEYRTLMNHIADTSLFRISELKEIANVLGLKDEDVIKIFWEMR